MVECVLGEDLASHGVTSKLRGKQHGDGAAPYFEFDTFIASKQIDARVFSYLTPSSYQDSIYSSSHYPDCLSFSKEPTDNLLLG